MPFDVRDFPGALPEDRATSQRNRRLVATWLFVVAGMILVMIVLGGVTRLTGSGLSIMEWAPVSGILPPLNHADWESCSGSTSRSRNTRCCTRDWAWTASATSSGWNGPTGYGAG